jgi:hypothetical protein
MIDQMDATPPDLGDYGRNVPNDDLPELQDEKIVNKERRKLYRQLVKEGKVKKNDQNENTQ